MKKKVNVFGKSVPVLLLVLLGMGLVSAALVGYLSNMVTANVEVDSPMEQWIDGGSGWTQESITFDSIRGGESITFYVKTQNNADIEITGNAENIVEENSLGVTCADFESVLATTTTDSSPITYDLIEMGLCSQGEDDNHVVFSYGPIPIVWETKEIDETTVVVTFKTDAVGTYTFTSQIVPVIT